MIELDSIDAKILYVMQRDSGLSQREIADQVGLSQNACWRRIARLTQDGVLVGQHAQINPALVGMDLTVFVMIKTRSHNADWSKAFRAQVESIPEVVEFYRIGGEWDYLIKVVTTSMAGYDSVYRHLTDRIDIATVTGYFAMETILSHRPIAIKANKS